MLALVLTLALAGSVSAAGQPVEVALLNYQPTPAQPGDLVDVNIQVANDGRDPVSGVQLELLGGEGLRPEGQAVKNIGTIVGEGAFTASFKIRVASTAQPGERLFNVAIRQTGYEEQSATLSMTVQAQDSSLVISSAGTEPETLAPGEEGMLHLTLQNAAGQTARDVTVALDLDDIPVVPVTESARKQVSTLSAGRSTRITFPVVVDPDATADAYKLPVTITYLDESGATQTQSETIGIRINSPTDTKAYLDDVSRTTDGKVEFAIRIVNRGLSEVRFVEAQIPDGDNYHVAPEDAEVYVGNIDSDDWETLRVRVTTDASEIQVPLTYIYRDAFNNQQERTQSFTVEVPPQQTGGASGLVVFLVIVVVLVIGIIWWRRRKKK